METTETQAIELSIEYESADDLLADFANNLSSGEAFVTTGRELPVDARVVLGLTFPALIKPIMLDGTVRSTRHADDDGIAAACIELRRDARVRLATLIERIRARDPELIARLVRVLLVEDNCHVAAILRDGLRAAIRRELRGAVALTFQTAEDGRGAVEMLRREAFDALIIDVYLPVLDGPGVIAQARKELGLSKLSIIAMSAGGAPARTAALRAGADSFLDKPMRVGQVTEVIKRLLSIGSHRDPSSGLVMVT
jgi:CheY-like chemotaxis protein